MPEGQNLAFRHRSWVVDRNIGPLVMLACVAILLALAAPAQATFPGDNGKIAFDRVNPGIDTINADGSGRAGLINDGLDPAWSPAGDKIAFESTRDGNSEIYVMNADGSGHNRLTTNTANDYSPAWSPDSTKIAFVSFRSPGGIYVMDADGSNQTQLTNGGGDPAWSPDGTKIALATSINYGSEIATVNVDGISTLTISIATVNVTTGFRRLPTPWWYTYPDPSEGCYFTKRDFNLDWSPDGQKIVFVHEEQDDCVPVYANTIATINADGTGARGIYEDYANYLAAPAWSPDGSLIAAVKTDLELFLIDPDGRHVRTLVGYSPTQSTNNPTWQRLRPPGYARPKAATPSTIRLVPALEPCTSPNSSHGPPLVVPQPTTDTWWDSRHCPKQRPTAMVPSSCNPPQPTSDYLTVGIPDAVGNGKAANFTGYLNAKVLTESPIDPTNGDQSDVTFTVNVTDVRDKQTLSDYSGELRASFGLRLTDRLNGPGGVHPATAVDTTFGFTFSSPRPPGRRTSEAPAPPRPPPTPSHPA